MLAKYGFSIAFRHVARSTSAGKPEGKRPLERSKRRWEDNIIYRVRVLRRAAIMKALLKFRIILRQGIIHYLRDHQIFKNNSAPWRQFCAAAA
jgi:hypothetical protein